MLSSNQRGRGYEPVMVQGRMVLAVVVSMVCVVLVYCLVDKMFSRKFSPRRRRRADHSGIRPGGGAHDG